METTKMERSELKELAVRKCDPEATLPTRAHANDAGMDLYALNSVIVEPGQGTMVRTGVAVAIPDGFFGMIADRSSMAKKGIKTCGGIIDSGYRGEIQVILWNMGQQPAHLERGHRIAQLIVFPIATPMPVEVATLDTTVRGSNGFGSSGI